MVNFCRICKSDKLVGVLDLGSQALSSRFPKNKDDYVPTIPLKLVKCMGDCGLVQLEHTTDRDELYKHFYGYASGINTTMRNHLASINTKIQDIVSIKETDSVLDIGCNDGTLLKNYNVGCEKVGIDPTGEQFRSCYPDSITLISDYFDDSVVKEKLSGKKFKAVTSISMFYDLPDPVGFAKNVESVMDDNGIWVMEQSYLPKMLETNSFDTVCHEHLEYYSLKQIVYIADKSGLKVIDVSFNDTNGGSFCVILAKKHSEFLEYKVSNILEDEKYLDNPETYERFRNSCTELKTKLLEFLRNAKEKGANICIYGASTKGNVLLQYCGIDNTLIDCASERNPNKCGRYIPCSSIPIKSEKEVRELNPDYLLVLPWHFKKEIIEREKEYKGVLIFPLPTLEFHATLK